MSSPNYFDQFSDFFWPTIPAQHFALLTSQKTVNISATYRHQSIDLSILSIVSHSYLTVRKDFGGISRGGIFSANFLNS